MMSLASFIPFFKMCFPPAPAGAASIADKLRVQSAHRRRNRIS